MVPAPEFESAVVKLESALPAAAPLERAWGFSAAVEEPVAAAQSDPAAKSEPGPAAALSEPEPVPVARCRNPELPAMAVAESELLIALQFAPRSMKVEFESQQ